MVGPAHKFGYAVRALDLVDPLGNVAEHVAVVDLLPGLSAARVPADLADEDDERSRILPGSMDADAGIGGARTTGHEAHAGLPGQLAMRLGHVGRTALLPADHEADRVPRLVERLERRQKALARHAVDSIGTVETQGVNKDLAPRARGRRGCHSGPPLFAFRSK